VTPRHDARRALFAVVAAFVVVSAVSTPAFADSIREQQWYLSELDISHAQQISEGAGVTVALIDTGVLADHRDLSGAILRGTDVNPGERGDGRHDSDGHGTEMAGIIAGRGHGTGDGVLGIAPRAKILPISAPVKGLGTNGFMTQAIDFAIAHHAGVINMSFGTDDDATMHDAIRKAIGADIVVVAASGNDEQNGTDYPGKYPEVLSVGAYGRDGKIASFSTVGPQVDLTAPGVDIVTTANQPSRYFKSRGTSEATAIVSGAAALLRAKYPELSAADIVHRLTATATDAGAKGRDDSYGYGRLDVVKALTADVAPLGVAGATPSAGAGVSARATEVEAGDLPAAKSPLLLLGIVIGAVVLFGALVIGVLAGRRRRAG
jgi:type VII secretion-associated serine protease mycosin